MLEFLGAQAPFKMVELFCKNPTTEFYSKEVGKRLDISKATTIKWLKNLKEKGILSENIKGRKKFYRLKLGNTLSRQIRVLFTISELTSALEKLSGLKSAYLVGNSAKGTGAPDSPIELLVLHRGNSRRIESVLDDVSSELGRRVEARIMTPLEYAELSRKNKKLHEKMEQEKIRLTIP